MSTKFARTALIIGRFRSRKIIIIIIALIRSFSQSPVFTETKVSLVRPFPSFGLLLETGPQVLNGVITRVCKRIVAIAGLVSTFNVIGKKVKIFKGCIRFT